MQLTTRYLGFTLPHPFMIGASPLADHLDTVKRLEDGGSAAIVLRSLFEEQISFAESGRIHQMDPYETEFAGALASFPPPERYAMAPDAYLEHIRRVKAAVAIPVVASLNGTSAESWLKFARSIEQAGADALELNMYEVVADPAQSAAIVEDEIRQIVTDVTRYVTIPVAVKVSPFFTAFTHFARQLDAAGADGLVLFNRFYQPDVDIETMAVVPRLELSTNAELLLRLRWVATLHDQVRCSLAVTGGVETPSDGIKAVIAGAHAVQMVSAILRHGPAYFADMRDGLARWMESRHVESIDEVRGRVDGRGADASVLERGDYIRTLHSWTR